MAGIGDGAVCTGLKAGTNVWDPQQWGDTGDGIGVFVFVGRQNKDSNKKKSACRLTFSVGPTKPPYIPISLTISGLLGQFFTFPLFLNLMQMDPRPEYESQFLNIDAKHL